MRVLKFGGSSVASATAVSRVLDIVGKALGEDRVILVSSAISGCTDALIALGECYDGDAAARLEARHHDIIKRLFTGEERAAADAEIKALFDEMAAAPSVGRVTFGELFSTRIIARKAATEGIDVAWLDSRNLVVKGDDAETFARIKKAVESSGARLFVAPGFIASDADGKVCTLGRGGSDYSAALYAAAVGAPRLEIWTDVPGIMTANPKDVPSARTISEMSYQAALEMAEHGAKVLYAPTVAPTMKAGIPIRILNTFDPTGLFTVISASHSTNRGGWIGLASRKVGDKAEICLVGDGERSGLERISSTLTRSGIAFGPLSKENGNIIFSVAPALEKEALKALHREFFEGRRLSSIDVFIAGTGAVGMALTEMIGDTAPTVRERTGKALRILGIGNTTCSLFDAAGLNPSTVWESLPSAQSEEPFVEKVLRVAPEGAIFVDCTDSEDIYLRYSDLMAKGLSIVSSNRRSLAIPYHEYSAMIATARSAGVFLRYETTVGAALPVLESVARGTNTCDEVLSIEAVVSCTLNQILGEYSEGKASFASLLRRAQDAGLTEADPRLDLEGKDALRKLLILAREAGIPLDESDVKVQSLVPPSLHKCGLEAFYAGMEEAEPSLREELMPRGDQRPRYVAVLEKDPSIPLGYSASIGIRFVGPEHPAWQLSGTENAVIVRSAFHPYPLVISGAGEGARLAASSILNDILR